MYLSSFIFGLKLFLCFFKALSHFTLLEKLGNMCNHLLMTLFVTGRTVLRLVPPLFRRIGVLSSDLLDTHDRWRCSTLNARYIKYTVTDCLKVA